MLLGSRMVIFATPDFGALGSLSLLLLITWAAVLGFSLLGIVVGMRLRWRKSPTIRRCGFLLVLVSGLIPFCCCLAPPYVDRVVHGNYPIGSYPNNKIKEGMSAQEVTAILGTPHEQFRHGEDESWYYWIDSFGIYWFGVDFGPDRRVIRTYGN